MATTPAAGGPSGAASTSSSSNDPLLTTLCAICHIQPPKYKCPACDTRTCSLACTRRHKAWSSCSGIRDATAYVPRARLRTPAGVDHDYNFLHGIERAVQRAEREIVEERRLLAEDELRPVEIRSVQWRRQKDGSKKKVLVTEMRRRLATFGIHVRRAPTGMSRQKENGTNVHKASGRIHWQVEWLLLEPGEAKEADTKVEVEADDNADNSSSDEEHDDRAGRNKIPTTRFLGKAMDNAPLYSAFGHGHRAHLNALRKKEEQQQRNPFDVAADPSTKPKSRPKQPPPQAATQSQDPSTGTWLPGHYVLQPHPHPAWKPYAGATHFKSAAAPEPEDMPKDKYRFFISPVRSPFAAAAAAAAPSSEAKVPVHALDPTTSLAEALRDTTVLEFPTIYALPADAALPSAFALTPKRDPADATAQKRKRDAASQSRRPQDQKGKKKPRRRLEDGEVASDDDDNDDAGSVQGGTSNLMEIVAEESLGDDDDEDEDDDDDDATSSSGSDDSDGEDDATINASIARKLASLGRI
ncbi:putative box C/D snoRNA protein like [Verticillium longisporum]|nr:putative box C/D snoRNA protein like [Verticillium longisporum]